MKKFSTENVLFHFFQRQFLQVCSKYASEQIIVKIECSKHQKLFKTMITNIFQDIYCRAHKTATLTPIQYIVLGPRAVICMHLCLCNTLSQDCPHGEVAFSNSAINKKNCEIKICQIASFMSTMCKWHLMISFTHSRSVYYV